MNCVHSTNVYIMTHERTDFLKECIDSIINNKKYIEFNFFISDSSKNNKVSEFIRKNYPKLNYIRQEKSKCKTQADHFNQIIYSNKSDYIIVFHDDDIFTDKCILTLINKLNENSNIGAVCSNGFKIEKNLKTKKLVNDTLKKNIIFNNHYDFMLRYLKVFNYSVNPFSAYIFRDNLVKKINREHKEGMVWSDATFLIKLSKTCKILWLHEPLMYYRIHSNSESSGEEVSARLSFLRFIRKNFSINKTFLKDYKIYFIIRYLFKNKTNNNRRKKYIGFLIQNFIHLIFLIPWFLRKVIKRLN